MNDTELKEMILALFTNRDTFLHSGDIVEAIQEMHAYVDKRRISEMIYALMKDKRLSSDQFSHDPKMRKNDLQ